MYAPFWNQFTINEVRLIGTGGLGVVHEVVVTRSNGSPPVGTRLARKRLNAKFAKDAHQRARFEREIDQTRTLSHPRIVPYRGENIGGERFYLMPLYRESLRQFLARNGKQSWKVVAGFGAVIADAMTHAHAHNCFHRDIKPENILLDDNGNPHIGDWGLGQFIHKQSKVLDLTRAGMGTEWYCSVEQWANGEGTHLSDIYSLGMMLAEMIHGSRFTLAVPGVGVTFDVVAGDRSVGAQRMNATLRRMTVMTASSRYANMATTAENLSLAARS